MVNGIDVKDTLAMLDEIVEEFGDQHKVDTCKYMVPRDHPAYVEGEVTPSCIVGQVIFRVGGRDALLSVQEDVSCSSYTNTNVLRELGFSYEAINVLTRVQNTQDSFKTWAVAVSLGHKWVESNDGW